MKHRILAIISLLVALGMVMSACAPAAPTTVTSPGTTVPEVIKETVEVPVEVVVTATPEPTKAPKPGGILIAARAVDATGLDPHKQTAFASFRVMEQLYDTLVTLDKDMNIIPALASSYEWSTDGLTLTMKVRDGVKFHDGTPLTSADVKYSFDRILNEETGAAARSLYTSISNIETPDDATVVFTLSAPNGALLAAMTSANSSIISKTWMENGNDPAADVNGTGAFKLVSWEPDNVLKLEKNPDFWISGEPYLDGIEFRTIPDEASILAGLRAGEIDFALINDPRVAITAGATNSSLKILRSPALAYHVLQLNPAREMFQDVRVRQAVSCAIDRQQVLDTASLGEGEVTAPVTPVTFRAPLDQLFCYQKDIEKSKALLAEAGVESFDFTIIAASDEPPTAVAEAQNLQAQLSEIGINAKIETLELGVYVDRWLKGDFDAAIALNGGNIDPHNMLNRYWLSTGNLQGVSNYSTPELDALITEGAAETDPAKRYDIYLDVQKQLAEASPWVWLYVGFEYRVMQPYVENYTPLSNGAQIYLREVWLDK